MEKGLDGKTKVQRIAEEIAKQTLMLSLYRIDRYMPRSGFQDQLKKLSKQLDVFLLLS